MIDLFQKRAGYSVMELYLENDDTPLTNPRSLMEAKLFVYDSPGQRCIVNFFNNWLFPFYTVLLKF